MKPPKLKKLIIVILLVIISGVTYVEMANRNSKSMTARQKILKAIYPLFTGLNRIVGKNSRVLSNHKKINPLQSFYDLSILLNDGNKLAMRDLKGKKILLVNTASDCGYTGQYAELQSLYQRYKDKLFIVAFPANDFRNQENRTDAEIEKFCVYNYGVSFPLAAKSVVIRSLQQNDVYQWLTDKNKNGWNHQQPSWNFSKYIVNEQGVLIRYFDPAISPQSDEVIKAILHG